MASWKARPLTHVRKAVAYSELCLPSQVCKAHLHLRAGTERQRLHRRDGLHCLRGLPPLSAWSAIRHKTRPHRDL